MVIPSVIVAQTAEQLLEEAFYLESTALDPQGAIEKYQAVIAIPDLERATAARAHLRLGICYHLLGRSRKAREELERVTTHFTSETDAVKLARRILGQSVVENPARFLPPDALFFAEIVDPEKHTHQLLELLKDTPFQNPVDVYRSYLEQQTASESGDADGGNLNDSVAGNPEGGAPPPTPADPQVVRASAILNEGILRELGNIQGAALCYPSVERGSEEFIFVLFPGKSHIIRGALQFYLAESNSRVVATVGGFPIFETPGQDGEPGLYIAFSYDVVLISNRKGSVQESIERSLGKSTSLADNQDYQATRSARPGSLIFSYIHSERLLRLLEREIKDHERQAFRATVTALGLDRLRASSVTLSVGTNDSLELSLRLNWGTESPEAWEVFRTPHPRWDVLSTIPRESLGFLSFGLDRGAERWAALGSLARGFVGRLPELEQAKAERQLEWLNSAVAESTREFMAALSQVVVGLVPTPTRQLWPSFFLILRFDEPESGPRQFEAALGDFAYLFFANEASRHFRTESVSDGQTELPVRVLEPVPRITIESVDLGDRLVVATSRQTLELVLRERNTPRVVLETVPKEAFKALFLRPAAISQQAKRLRRSSPSDAGRDQGLDVQSVLFEEIPSALLYSREKRGRLLLTLTIPEFRSTSRAILNRLGTRAPVVQIPDVRTER